MYRSGTAFVGRDVEMTRLVATMEDSLVGRGQLFMLAGEPGIGKTRLAQELARHASTRGAAIRERIYVPEAAVDKFAVIVACDSDEQRRRAEAILHDAGASEVRATMEQT